MLKEISSIKIQGANFISETELLIFDSTDGKLTKLSLVYGRNGSGKSTIAKAFRRIKGESISTIIVSNPISANGIASVLSETDKASIFVFDEDFLSANVRIEGKGLGSIVMLGEQADLAAQIEEATKEIADAEKVFNAKKDILMEYQEVTNPKAPQFYIEKMKTKLSTGPDCWADRERRAKDQRRNSSVSNDTYKKFTGLSPEKTRDELIIVFKEKMDKLSAAKSGAATIGTAVPSVPNIYKGYTVSTANEMLKRKIEKPELTEREQFLLSLLTSNHIEELQKRIEHLNDEKTTYCPYCLQDLTPEYRTNLVGRIQKILADEVKRHQEQLHALKVQELELDLSAYSTLDSFQICTDLVISLNNIIRANNNLLQNKIDNSYIPIIYEELTDIANIVSALETNLKKLEEERISHNKKAVMVQPIVDELVSINDQVAHYDIIELSRQYDSQIKEMETIMMAYKDADSNLKRKKMLLDELDSKRKRIDIAIDIINNGLKYIFFADNRLTIERDGDIYKLLSNGRSIEPKDVSVGERNIIGLCYFFTSMFSGKNKDVAYNDEYLIVIDDPVSSFDFENKVGILSFLKYKLGQFLKGNANTRAIVMTHDLLTMFDLVKIAKVLNDNWSFPCIQTKYNLNELKNCALDDFRFKKRQEYTELVNLIFHYANGKATEYDIVIGNIMRQVLEAFSTFKYKKGIDTISTDDIILDESGMCEEHKAYFKNLMYRVVLNGGSHREEQTRSMDIDFFAVISETEKRRTAQEILCFIYLLDKPHIIAHLGDVSGILDNWCEIIKSRSAAS